MFRCSHMLLFFISPPRARGSTYLRLSPAKVFQMPNLRGAHLAESQPGHVTTGRSVFGSVFGAGLCRMLQLSRWPAYGVLLKTWEEWHEGQPLQSGHSWFFYDHGRPWNLTSFQWCFILLISWHDKDVPRRTLSLSSPSEQSTQCSCTMTRRESCTEHHGDQGVPWKGRKSAMFGTKPPPFKVFIGENSRRLSPLANILPIFSTTYFPNYDFCGRIHSLNFFQGQLVLGLEEPTSTICESKKPRSIDPASPRCRWDALYFTIDTISCWVLGLDMSWL